VPKPAHAAAPGAVRNAYRNQAHEDILSAARVKGVEESAAGRAAVNAAPHIAAARSLADTGIGRALPGLKKALAGLPAKLQEAALGRAQRRADASTDTAAAATLDTVADALDLDLPGTRWRNGRDGVLDAPWAEDPALLPGLSAEIVRYKAAGAVFDSSPYRRLARYLVERSPLGIYHLSGDAGYYHPTGFNEEPPRTIRSDDPERVDDILRFRTGKL